MNFQNILQNILGNPIFIVILIGAFSTLARMFKSAQDQQAKKRANNELRQAQQDSLRTGSASPSAESGLLAPLQTQQTAPVDKKAAWDQKQQMRKDRIEQLRTQRIEQLKKLRQQRSGSQSQPSQSGLQQAQARSSQPQPTRVSQARTPTPTKPAVRTPATAGQAFKRPVAQPYAQPAPKQSRRSEQATPNQQPTSRRQSRPRAVPQQTQKRVSDDSRRVSKKPMDQQIAFGSIPNKSEGRSTGVHAMIRQDLRRAIVAREVLGPPVGLRSPGSEIMGNL